MKTDFGDSIRLTSYSVAVADLAMVAGAGVEKYDDGFEIHKDSVAPEYWNSREMGTVKNSSSCGYHKALGWDSLAETRVGSVEAAAVVEHKASHH